MRSSWARVRERSATSEGRSYADALEAGGIDWSKMDAERRARIAADAGRPLRQPDGSEFRS